MAKQDQITRLIELGVSFANANARDAHLAVAALAQEAARGRVAANAPAALTDNSGGVAGSALAPVANPVAASHDGGTHADKASFDTAIGDIHDAVGELVALTNTLLDGVSGNASMHLSRANGAAAPNDTIEAIPAVAGATDNLLDPATGLAQIVVARNNQAALAAAINFVRVAMGMDTLPDMSGGIFEASADEWLLEDTAATAAAVTTTGAGTFTLASVNAAITALKNNVATMAASLNELRGDLSHVGPLVVATNNAKTRFRAGST